MWIWEARNQPTFTDIIRSKITIKNKTIASKATHTQIQQQIKNPNNLRASSMKMLMI